MARLGFLNRLLQVEEYLSASCGQNRAIDYAIKLKIKKIACEVVNTISKDISIYSNVYSCNHIVHQCHRGDQFLVS